MASRRLYVALRALLMGACGLALDTPGSSVHASPASRPAAAPASASSDQQDRRAAIRAALQSVGHYVANVLITPEGKGRADYDLMQGQWLEYEPHWHTGQQIWGLLEAWRITREPALMDAAKRGGNWWIGTEFQAPHPLAGLVNAYHGDHIGPLINFTTISDGTPGLFALTRATQDKRYADTATRSGRWLWANTAVPESIPGGQGLFYNFIDPANGRIITDTSPTHRGVANPLITQTARPNMEGFLFKDMCLHTRETVWCERFLNQARAALARQDAKGLWMDFEPNNPQTGDVHPRFNIWNAEALLEAYALSGDRAFLEGAARTGRFMASVQRPDGAIYYNLKNDGTFRRDSITGSATAFSGILWMRLADYGVTGFESNIARSLNWVLANRFPLDHPDPNLRGAVLETRVRVVDGATRIAIRDIASAFSLRFLAMAHDDLSGQDVNRPRP
jgi:hypothetical protein